MPKLRSILGGMVGAMALGSISVGAQAQDAGASGCSGILCVFSSAPPARAAPPPPPAQPVADAPAAEAPTADAVVHSKPKPRITRPAVTIAADPAEAPRLKELAAAMPKEHVRIVKTLDAAAADFAVSTTLDTRPGAETAKLFTEQMHVLAGAKVGALADLAGKVVSFGPDKSASQAAGRKAFAALGIAVKETPLDLDNALDGLATGDIDAVVVLAPQPDSRLAKLAGPGLHLVAWPRDATLPDGAVATSIDGARYPRLARAGEAIPALGVDAVLSPKGSLTGARQAAARSFLAALSQHSAALSKHGFDLLKADLDARADRHVAEVGAR